MAIFIPKKQKLTDPGILVSESSGKTLYNRSLEGGFMDRRDSIIQKALRGLRPSRWKEKEPTKAYTVKGAEALTTMQAAGTSFGTFTTAKTVLNVQTLLNLPPGDLFWYIGKQLRITVVGGLGTLVTTPGTVTFQNMIGANIAFTTGAIQLNATAHTNLPFWLDILLTVQVLGSGTTAKFMGVGRAQGIMFTLTAAQTDAVNTGGIFSAPATAPAQGAGFDSTITNVLDFFTAFSISSASNTVQLATYIVEALN